MRIAYPSRPSAELRPLPRELRQVWSFAAVILVLSTGFVFATTQEIGLTGLAAGASLVGGAVASVKAWLTSIPE